jgi:hypothetical protein
MACIRRLPGHWRKNGHCHINDPQVFYLYVVHDTGFTSYRLPVCCFLDEYQEIYFECEAKPVEISLSLRRPPHFDYAQDEGNLQLTKSVILSKKNNFQFEVS